MDESLDFSLSWGRFVYNVDKSYIEMDLARFFVCYLMIELWGQNFSRPKTCYNLIRI